MFFWTRPARAPTAMEMTATAIRTSLHWCVAPGKPCIMARANSTMAASFGAAARKATTGVGAPS